MSGPRRRNGPEARAWAGVVLLLLLALGVVAERARWFARLLGAAGVERTWIWSADPPRKVEPSAFLLARDFDLASFSESARLEVLGDPEYVVYVNGERLGSGIVTAANEIHVYAVAPLLRLGSNRIVLELRSPTGSGAATLRLDDGLGDTALQADGDWTLYRSAWSGLLAGEPFYPAGKAVQLAASPFGRWSAAKPGISRPRYDQVVAAGPEGAAAWRRADESAWRPMPAEASRRGRLGDRIEVDFGREVTGYLYLVLGRRPPARGLVRFGLDLAASPGWNPDAVVLTLTGRGLWQDAEPRRFRYVELVGLEQLTWVAFVPTSAAGYARLASPRPAALLGAVVRPVRLPVVDEIWRRFEGPPKPGAPAEPGLRRDVAARTPAPAPARSGRHNPAARQARQAPSRPTP